VAHFTRPISIRAAGEAGEDGGACLCWGHARVSHDLVLWAIFRKIRKRTSSTSPSGMYAGLAAPLSEPRAKMALENQFGQIYPPQEYLDDDGPPDRKASRRARFARRR
jgi:hypothetical protein